MDPQDLHATRIFFYGTFMSAEVLQAFGLSVPHTKPAKIFDFQLSIRPRVNLTPCQNTVIYGAVAHLSHTDIYGLYSGLKDAFGIVYYPHPVLAHLTSGDVCTALCYISPSIPDADPDAGYVKELARCAKNLGASEAYIAHINSFLV